MVTQLQRLCDAKGIKITCEWIDSNPHMSDMPAGSMHFKVTLTRRVNGGKRQITTPFSQGPAHTKEPSAADVLSCLISDARLGEETFESFCGDMGLDTDSRKAEATWKACQAMAPKIARFLEDDREEFERADH